MATRVVMHRDGVLAIKREAQEDVTGLAEAMASDMRRYVAVDTGELRATIRVVPGTLITRIYIGDVSRGIDYHLYLEFGTSVMQAQPFIRPAVFQRRG